MTTVSLMKTSEGGKEGGKGKEWREGGGREGGGVYSSLVHHHPKKKS